MGVPVLRRWSNDGAEPAESFELSELPRKEAVLVDDEPTIRVVAAGEGEDYSPDTVPEGINMTLPDWAALSDLQRQMIGDRRFARRVTPEL